MSIGRHVYELAGYAPALPTPFDDNDAIDAAAFENFCELQISNGATALVAGGTTGEAPNLSREEHRRLLHVATEVSCGRVPIIAGAGSNSTQHAIELTKDAEASGADAILSIVPYYNRPTQAGLYTHFSEIDASTGLPIILYDVPARTACSLADETVARLAELPQIAGLKDATGNPSRIARLRMLVGTDFRLLAGDDATALSFIAQGGDGCISVTSNVAPRLCSEFHVAWQKGDVATALKLHDKLMPLHTNLFIESNPAPVKYALSLLGKIDERLRLPMVPVSEPTRIAVRSAMVHAGLIN